MAAGCLFIALWAVERGSATRVLVGAILLTAGMFMWYRGIGRGGAGE